MNTIRYNQKDYFWGADSHHMRLVRAFTQSEVVGLRKFMQHHYTPKLMKDANSINEESRLRFNSDKIKDQYPFVASKLDTHIDVLDPNALVALIWLAQSFEANRNDVLSYNIVLNNANIKQVKVQADNTAIRTTWAINTINDNIVPALIAQNNTINQHTQVINQLINKVNSIHSNLSTLFSRWNTYVQTNNKTSVNLSNVNSVGNATTSSYNSSLSSLVNAINSQISLLVSMKPEDISWSES